MPNELIEKWTKLNQKNKEAIERFSENYTEVMKHHLTSPQMTVAVVEEAIKKLSENYRTITDLTRQQMEMVNEYMGTIGCPTYPCDNNSTPLLVA